MMIENEAREYNLRQVRLMENKASAFMQQQISLRNLIDSLEALLSVLQNPAEEFVQQMQKWWSTLEIIYSVCLDQERSPSQNEAEKIYYAIEQILLLVIDYKKELEKEEQV